MKTKLLKLKYTLVVGFAFMLIIFLLFFTLKNNQQAKKELVSQIDNIEVTDQPEIERFKAGYEYRFPNYDAYLRLLVNNKKQLSHNDRLKVTYNLKKLYKDRFIDEEAFAQEMREIAANLKMKLLETKASWHTKNICNIKENK